MADPADTPDPRRRAESVFEEWLAQADRIPFENLVAQHPDIGVALRLLHDQHRDGSIALESSEATAAYPIPSLASPGELREGAVVGPYVLEKELGRGGFGVVYRALQREPVEQHVALKALRENRPPRDTLVRFEIERQALALMNHPSIPKFLGAGETGQGTQYYVMEYVEGSPLTGSCDDRAMGPGERLELFLQVCDAIRHAHLKGVIHRDLKPRNLLVSRLDGGASLPKVIDFGLAKGLENPILERTEVTSAGTYIGTLVYMSPEQAGVIDENIDTRADVYALGVILYELLAGVRPLAAAETGTGKFLNALGSDVPPSLAKNFSRLETDARERIASCRGLTAEQLRRKLDRELDLIVQKALEKRPDDRYASVAELMDDLGRYVRNEPLAMATGIVYRARKFWQRHRVGVSVAALVALILIGGPILSGALERSARIAEAERLRERGRQGWESYREGKERVDGELRELWWQKRSETVGKPWLPVWERVEELIAWKQMAQARLSLEPLLSEAVFHLQSALRESPADTAVFRAARKDLSRIHLELSLDARRSGGITFSDRYFETLVRGLGEPQDVEAIRGGRLTLSTEPASAEVYCFRYVDLDGCLQPMPFDPGVAGEDPEDATLEARFLEVERVWQPGPFQEGDRILDVNGQESRTRGGLARALGGVEQDQSIPVVVSRQGSRVSVSWVPFPDEKLQAFESDGLPFRAGRLVDIRAQLDLTFAGYPLEFLEHNHVGSTSRAAPLEIDLPRGSYLIVLRKEGHEDVRFPVEMPFDAGSSETIRLLKKPEIPDRFVRVPAGRAATGGDFTADQAIAWENQRIAGFFMGRFEITVAEWFGFLNDRDVDPDGKLEPSDPQLAAELAELSGMGKLRDEKIQAVPIVQGKLFFKKTNGRWGIRFRKSTRLDMPVFGISQHAAREYAHWRTVEAETKGDPWKFRLPTDLEFERAARGVDRRAFAWGSYMVWHFCSSTSGNSVGQPHAVGSYPLDESVFGIRDLTGSVREPTPHVVRKGYRYVSFRGGSWYDTEEVYFRLASRNGRYPEDGYRGCGVRLVAELRD